MLEINVNDMMEITVNDVIGGDYNFCTIEILFSSTLQYLP